MTDERGKRALSIITFISLLNNRAQFPHLVIDHLSVRQSACKVRDLISWTLLVGYPTVTGFLVGSSFYPGALAIGPSP